MASRSSRRRKEKAAKKSSPRLMIFVASLVIVAVIIVYVVAGPAGQSAVGVGGTAPNFSLQVVTAEGLTSRTVELYSLRGKVVALEFVVSWCRVCQTMAPAIDTLSREYEGKGVFFLTVAGTMGGASANSTAEFIRDYGARWTHVLDADNSVFSSYRVEATPTYFIIDRDGKVLSKFQGLVPTGTFQAAIDAALSA